MRNMSIRNLRSLLHLSGVWKFPPSPLSLHHSLVESTKLRGFFASTSWIPNRTKPARCLFVFFLRS